MKDIENTKKEAPLKESPFLGLTGMGGGVASLMFAGAAAVENTIWVTGRNLYGNLGQNYDSAGISSPTQVGTTSDWIMFQGGHFDWSMGIRGVSGSADDTNGTLWAMGGQSSWGELGQNNRASYSSPTQIGTESTWKTLSTGECPMVTKTDGTLWIWGHNGRGALGDNSNVPRSSPIQVGADTDWDGDIESKFSFSSTTLAIKSTGQLWAWGDNGYGKFGNNYMNWSEYKFSSPIQIGTSTNWKAVTGGSNTSIGLKTDGTLWYWGSNGNGVSGNNFVTGSSRSSPTQIGTETTWARVQMLSTAYAYGIAATKTDGTFWVWGRNVVGSLGLNESGYAPYYSSPTQLGTDSNWHTTHWNGAYGSEGAVQAFKTDGTLWMWGENTYGSLGINDRTARSSPTQVPGSWIWWDKGQMATGFIGKKEKE